MAGPVKQEAGEIPLTPKPKVMPHPAATVAPLARAEIHVAPPPPAVPPPPSPPNWIAIAAFALSAFTFVKTLWSDHVAGKTKLASQFESDFGSPLIQALRNFEQDLGTLRSFTLPDPRDIASLQADFGASYSKWVDGSFAVITLLEEIDSAEGCEHWAAGFRVHMDRSEEHLATISDAVAGATAEQLKSSAKHALSEYKQGIEFVRQQLRQQRVSFRPKLRGWLFTRD